MSYRLYQAAPGPGDRTEIRWRAWEPPEQWYLFQVNYAEQRSNYFQPSGRRLNGYVGAIEGTLYSDYVEISGDCAAKFKLYPAGDGWAYWQTDAGTWLSITRSGWLFSNSDSTRKVAWKIVDGHLYNLYWDKDNWKKYPAGGKFYFASGSKRTPGIS